MPKRRIQDCGNKEEVEKVQRHLINWFYPKLTQEERNESLRERGLPEETD